MSASPNPSSLCSGIDVFSTVRKLRGPIAGCQSCVSMVRSSGGISCASRGRGRRKGAGKAQTRDQGRGGAGAPPICRCHLSVSRTGWAVRTGYSRISSIAVTSPRTRTHRAAADRVPAFKHAARGRLLLIGLEPVAPDQAEGTGRPSLVTAGLNLACFMALAAASSKPWPARSMILT